METLKSKAETISFSAVPDEVRMAIARAVVHAMKRISGEGEKERSIENERNDQ